MTLNRRQRIFAQEYLVDLNAKQAAIRAGYSPKTAKSVGYRLLTYVDVMAEVTRRLEDRAKRNDVDADRVIEELARLAFGDLRSIVQVTHRWKGRGEAVRGMDPGRGRDRQAEVAQTRQGIRVKMHPKLQALEALAKHLGMYVTRLNVNLEASLTLGDPASMTDDEQAGTGGMNETGIL